MIALKLHASAAELGIENPVACLIRKFEIVPSHLAALDDEVASAVAFAQRGGALDAPTAMGFVEVLRRLGYQTVPAGHRLTKRVAEKGFPRYNNVIDACNICSLEFGAGLGLHDATAITSDLELYRAKGTEQIIPLGKDKPKSVRVGDLAYGFGDQLLAWLGSEDVDSNVHKVTEGSRYLLFMVLGNRHTTAAFNRSVCLRMVHLMKRTSPGTYAQFVPTERVT